MKLILITIAVFFNVSLVCAQVMKPNSVVAASRNSYTTSKIGSKYTSMIIKNNANKLDKQMPGLEGGNLDYELTDKNSLVDCFKSVFNSARLQQLLPENNILISTYINSSGKILEVSFMLKQNTLITAQEIEELESQIKKNVAYKIRPGVLKENKFYVVNINMKYDKIINGVQ